ncbi:MAG: hypothetical protein M3092_08420 [Actinomycetia bacterium]|nr:hypothetical protein [Actinomycetes bacterium]
MTPYTHTTSDVHINVYQQEVRDSIGRSKAHPGALRSLRRHVARGLVRTGAWLLPEKPEVIGGTVFVLPKAPDNSAGRKAA